MINFGNTKRAILAILFASLIISGGQDAISQSDTLEYGIEFVEKKYSELPALQSFAYAVAPSGKWIVVGGRGQGLHGFAPGGENSNFSRFNSSLFVIDPANGTSKSLSIEPLPAAMRDALISTNAQQHYDAEKDTLYIVGGYGIDTTQQPPRKTTFNTITAFNVTKMIAAVEAKNIDDVKALLRQSRNDHFAVTGGGMAKIGSRFMLVFGQYFDGEFVFDARPPFPYVQKYTEAVRVFTLDERTLEVELYAQLTSGASDRPFHRRDLNVLPDIDPATGTQRVAVFGGVFRPGALLGYGEPIYIENTNTVSVDRSFKQKMSQYECGVIPVYSKKTKTMSRTFFGGITSKIITAEQAAHGTSGGPSDGMPWENRISRVDCTFDSSAKSVNYKQYDLGPIAGNRFLGAEARFFPKAEAKEMFLHNEIVNLDNFKKGSRIHIGYLYSGIESSGPQQEPRESDNWSGTKQTNAFFDVYLNYNPTEAKLNE